MQNEYGLAAWKVIVGVEILNTGGGLSVDDITNEEQATFVARTMTPWVPWAGKGADASQFDEINSSGQGLYFGTGQADPATSVIPTIDGNVIDAYKSWAGIGAGTEWPIT